MPLVFQTYVSGVVIEELYAGALDSQAVRLVERYVSALERAGRVIAPASRLERGGETHCPHYTARTCPEVENSTDLNDILISLCARRIGADLYTFNRDDFELIRRYRSFSLKLLKH
jgi:predicted nucleic acid-binding protein